MPRFLLGTSNSVKKVVSTTIKRLLTLKKTNFFPNGIEMMIFCWYLESTQKHIFGYFIKTSDYANRADIDENEMGLHSQVFFLGQREMELVNGSLPYPFYIIVILQSQSGRTIIIQKFFTIQLLDSSYSFLRNQFDSGTPVC